MAQPHFPATHQTRDDVNDWESEGGHLRRSDKLDDMGITRTLVETFSVGPHRYTKLEDAMAQARRSGARQR